MGYFFFVNITKGIKMTIQEALDQMKLIAETFENCSVARRKLAGNPLTAELFNELNGPDRGIENLIGDSVYLPELTDAEVVTLKSRILDAITESEMALAQKMHAALECFFEPLVKACQTFDANYENNAKLKTDLIGKLNSLAKDGETTFMQSKCDFMVFQYTHAVELCNILKEFSDFLDSKTCNLGRLTQLSTMNSGEMSDDDKTFLKEMREAYRERSDGFWRVCTISSDRITGASLADLGYDSKKLIELINTLFANESAFFATVRKFREALIKDTEPTEKVCVKNSEFDDTVGSVMWFLECACKTRNELWEELSLIDKQFDVQTPAKKPEEVESGKKDDQIDAPGKQDDEPTNTDDNKNPEEPNPDDNAPKE